MVPAPDASLTLTLLLDLLAGQHGDAVVVTAQDATSGRRTQVTMRELASRARRLAKGLAALGVSRGDRVATLAWNVQEHLECFWAVPCSGAVLHTLNPRQDPAQLAAMATMAGDRVLIAQSDLLPMAHEIMPRVPSLDRLIVIGGSSELRADATPYEALLAADDDALDWPSLNEHDGAGLTFTSGTVGAPKGVLYTHRMLVLHALVMAAFDPHRTPHKDRLLSVVPLFHAMGWNLPYIAALTGADLILPGRNLSGERLASLIREEAVTFSCGVPTVWTDVLAHLEATGTTIPSLRAVACGGSRVPEDLMRGFQELGVTAVQGWGMTETGPGAARVFDEPELPEDERWARRNTSGRIRPLYQARLRAEDGELAAHDGIARGEIEIRGPLVIRRYFGPDDASAGRFRDGWLRTGDIGTIDPEGWLRVVDREKDLIKSGGEWISSLELESALLEHPDVSAAAVIAIPDERWMERPLACVVAGPRVSAEELSAFLANRITKWWVPQHYAHMAELPTTATGKADKKQLRGRLRDGSLEVHVVQTGQQGAGDARPTT